ncbi:MAG: heavy-metal-associated domain-containing protein [Proteobacteria bacterium]|jgi:copper chaperone CopZ|nr:heavy-metal-associated domain-containing protein [Pseudomonadota bacterium]
MITYKVPEMHCEKCVARIHQTLDNANIKHFIDLKHKTVTIAEEDDQKTRDELEEIGFSTKKPSFFDKLFG